MLFSKVVIGFSVGVFFSLGCASRASQKSATRGTKVVTEDGRDQAIADADGWGSYWDGKDISKIEKLDKEELEKISRRNLKLGPSHKIFNPKSDVASSGSSGPLDLKQIDCTFVEPDPSDVMGGRTPKFLCSSDDQKKPFKVKYDSALTGCPTARNANVATSTEILATRLMWALGFRADSMYPAKVKCVNCPQEPWTYIRNSYSLSALDKFIDHNAGYVCENLPSNKRDTRDFYPVAIEKKDSGDKIETDQKQGWGFNEILNPSNMRSTETAKGKRQLIHREALAMMAAFLEHWDNKSVNQRLSCLDKESLSDACEQPFFIIQDPGFTFGTGWKPFEFNGVSALSVANDANPIRWAKETMWDGDSANCVIKVNAFLPEGVTLFKHKVSQEGAAFFAKIFSQLSKSQIADLMEAGQVETTRDGSKRQGPDKGNITKQTWIDSFVGKVESQVFSNKCLPAGSKFAFKNQ
jgi:hypothetical protein